MSDHATLDRLGALSPSRELFGAYLRDIVARLTANRDVTPCSSCASKRDAGPSWPR